MAIKARRLAQAQIISLEVMTRDMVARTTKQMTFKTSMEQTTMLMETLLKNKKKTFKWQPNQDDPSMAATDMSMKASS